MKYLLRVFLFNSFSLWLVSELLPALSISGGWQVILFAGLVLSLLMLIIAPILKILFIPINIITFGLFSWLINGIVLYLLTVFVPQVTISAWTFPGLSLSGFIIPRAQVSYAFALIVVSVALTFMVNILHDISES